MPCILRNDQSSKFGRAQTTSNDGLSVAPNVRPDGACGTAEHSGNPLWQHPSGTSLKAIERLSQNHPSLDLLNQVKTKVADDAQTLTISISDPDEAAGPSASARKAAELIQPPATFEWT